MAVLSLTALGVAFSQLALPACSLLWYQPQEGDLIFQSLPRVRLVEAIEGSTGSPYSHCGIVARQGNAWVVIEAIGPVKETPLYAYIRRGRRSFFDVYRPRAEHQPLVPGFLAAARRYLGRPYDIHYEWDDMKIYCSELIWKAWREAGGGRLGEPQRLGALQWQPYEAVIREIEHGGLPLEREMITPRAVAEAPQVERVFRFRPPSE